MWLSAVAPVTQNPSFSPLLKISKSCSQQRGVAKSKQAEALYAAIFSTVLQA